MGWFVAGFFVLGLLCGAAVRLPFFIVILLGAAAIAGIGSGAHGAIAALVNAVAAVVILQVGYAAGVVGRAVVRAWRSRRGNAARGRGKGAIAVTIEERRR